jgi:FG-GAP-like repeat
MNSPMHAVLAILSLSGIASAQQLLWQASSPFENYVEVATLGDLDRDGYADVLTICWVNGNDHRMRILSGQDGSILVDRSTPMVATYGGCGDFDGDGYPDYVIAWGAAGQPTRVQIWSPHLQQQLLLLTRQVTATEYAWGHIVAADLDLDGDGLPDVIVGSAARDDSTLRAYDHFGNPLYTIPVLAQYGIVARSILALGDLDGDGATDYVVGCWFDPTRRGLVALLSGRTGAVLHVRLGQQPNDILSRPLVRAGDVNGDGVPDYAVSNWGAAFRSLIEVHSGATGALLRQWSSTTYDIASSLVAGRDVDLDGIPDVVGGSVVYVNPSGWYGRVQTFSMRDQQLLAVIEPQVMQYCCYFADTMADLGIQPGSPYPVVAIADETSLSQLGRVQAWRLSPPGTQVLGAGCSSNGTPPTIGVRRVDTPAGVQSRIVLGSAPPGAFAWCAVAFAPDTTGGGVTVPLAMDPYGFANCTMLVPPVSAIAARVGPAGIESGYAQVDMPLPLVATLGTAYAAQWLVLDPTTLAYAATSRHEFRLQ